MGKICIQVVCWSSSKFSLVSRINNDIHHSYTYKADCLFMGLVHMYLYACLCVYNYILDGLCNMYMMHLSTYVIDRMDAVR